MAQQLAWSQADYLHNANEGNGYRPAKSVLRPILNATSTTVSRVFDIRREK